MASDWDYGLEIDYDHKAEMIIKTNRSKYINSIMILEGNNKLSLTTLQMGESYF